MPKFKNKPNLGKGSNDGAANRQIKARELKKTTQQPTNKDRHENNSHKG